MKFVNFSALLFLLNEVSFNLVSGKAINLKKGEAFTEEKFVLETGTAMNEEKNDCTKFYNFIRGDNKVYSIDECCSENDVTCENGYITEINANSDLLKISDFTGFPYFSKIKSLSSYSNGVKTLPEELFKLTTLERLDLYNNQIETIPPSIGSLKNLKNLQLNNNKIKNVPEELFTLSNLEKLNLSNNKLEAIPTSVGALSNLEELILSYNKIKTIPDELCKLPNLKHLRLENNEIGTLPPSINEIKKIEKYDLSDNKVKSLPDGSPLTNINDKEYDNSAIPLIVVIMGCFVIPICVISICICLIICIIAHLRKRKNGISN